MVGFVARELVFEKFGNLWVLIGRLSFAFLKARNFANLLTDLSFIDRSCFYF
jgi:hypothetical protein